MMETFQGENILQVELDMPNRTTRDYEGPSVAPKIQAVLDAALEDEGDIDIDDRSVDWVNIFAWSRKSVCYNGKCNSI